MTKSLLLSIALIIPIALILIGAGCKQESKISSEADQAAQYGLTVEQYRQEKQAAARMNMPLEAHLKTLKEENSSNMSGMMNHDMGNMGDMGM